MRRGSFILLWLAALLTLAVPVARADIPELAGNWHLDANDASSPDSSGHNLHAARVGSPTTVSPARFGNGLRFPTENDYLNAGNHAELQPANVSVLAWVRSPSTPTFVKGIVSQGAAGSCSTSSYSLYTGGSNVADQGTRFYVHTAGGTVKTTAVDNATVWNGQWHLLAGTYDGTTSRIYVDGQEAGSGTGPSGPVAYGLALNNDFIVGGALDPACSEQTNFTGDMDEVRVYSRALTPEELAYLARSDHTTPPELPVPGPVSNPNPPAPPAGRNTAAPTITRRTVDAASGLRVYSCEPGQWADLAADSQFTYTWWRMNKASFGWAVADTPMQSGSSPLYKLPTRDIGKAHYCEVSAQGADGQTVRAYTEAQILTGVSLAVSATLPPPFGNVRVRGIDVFQATQPNNNSPHFTSGPGPFRPGWCGGGTPTPFRPGVGGGCFTLGGEPQSTSYGGVSFDAYKRTFARVFVNMTSAKTPYPFRFLSVTLTGRLGTTVLGTDYWGITRDPAVTSLNYVSTLQRGDPSFSVPFEINPAWMVAAGRSAKNFSLEAEVSILPGFEGPLTECLDGAGTNCTADNRFRLTSLPVFELPALGIRTLPMLTHSQTVSTLNPPEQVLARTRQLFPGGAQFKVFPYDSALDIDLADNLQLTSPRCAPWPKTLPGLRNCRMAYVTQVMDNWMNRSLKNRKGYDIAVGVHRYRLDTGGGIEPGFAPPPALAVGQTRPAKLTVNDGSLNRPLTAAAHEFGHVMGAPHASTCNGATGAEDWPDDARGRLQGAAYDLLGTRVDISGVNELYDLMSYCAPETHAWISPFNWNRAFGLMRRFVPSLGLRVRSAQAGPAFVSGVFGPDGAQIVRVSPAGPDNLPDPPDPNSSIQVRALDAGGRQLTVVGARLDRLSEFPDSGTFAVGIPSGAAAVELVSGGGVLDRKARSKPPTVRVLAPRGGTRVGGGSGSALVVRWSASDPDRDELEATVEYAADGRSGWRPVFSGPNRGRASIPGRFLERGTAARVRVRVNDGFSEATALSRPFRAEGQSPHARIVSPLARTLRSTGAMQLAGQGLDDRNRTLRGRALTWFAGRRRLGNGERLRVKLPAGRVILRLRVRDSFGRVATDVRRVTVEPTHLELRTLRAPDRVGPNARTVRVIVATTTVARLRAGRRTFTVGPRARTITIPLPRSPRIGILKIPVTVTALGARQRVIPTVIVLLRG